MAARHHAKNLKTKHFLLGIVPGTLVIVDSKQRRRMTNRIVIEVLLWLRGEGWSVQRRGWAVRFVWGVVK